MVYWLILMLWLSPAVAQATTYYVGPTGSDTTGNGTELSPWATPQKCVSSGTPLVAGDTCLVGTGIYTDTDGNGIVVNISASSPAGTSSNPITIKSQVPLGAVIKVAAHLTANYGFFISRPYYIIEGFDIDGSGAANPNTAGVSSGISIWADNVTIRRNTVHDIGRTTCSNSVNAISGVATARAFTTIEYDLFYKIGRLRGIPEVQESGCTLTPGNQGGSSHDHAIYPTNADHLTMRRNVVYDSDRGYPLHIFTSSTRTNNNVVVEHNTTHGKAAVGGPKCHYQIGNFTNIGSIANNVLDNVKESPFCPIGGTYAGVVVQKNFTDSTDADWWAFLSAPPTGVTQTDPGTHNGSILFTNESGNDFTLSSASPGIDGGISTGDTKCGASEDLGAFEVCGPISASINTNVMDVTIETAFPPVQVFGASGWSVSCSGAGCPASPTVSGAALKSGTSGVVQLTITGITGNACAVGQTWTVSFDQSTGDLTDSINVGGWLNQPVHTFTSYAVTNNCSGSAPPSDPSPGTLVLHYNLNESSGTQAADSSGNGRHGTLSAASLWSAGLDGNGVFLADLVGDFIDTGWGDVINPSVTSYTFSFWVEVPVGNTNANRTYFGSRLGVDQRLHIGTLNGSWGLGIQGSALATSSNLSVSSGWHQVCLQMNAATDTATLYIDKIAGLSGTSAQKTYGSYVTDSTLRLGRPQGFTSSAPGAHYDEVRFYSSLVDCGALYDLVAGSSGSGGGTLAQVGHQWQIPSFTISGGIADYGVKNATVQVPKGGVVGLLVQVNRTAAAGSAFSPKLWYQRNGGTAQPLLDTIGSDGVAFVGGSVGGNGIYSGAAVCCVEAGLTANNGPTQVTAADVAVYAAGVNQAFVRRVVIRFATSASGSYCFFERDQAGTGFNGGYTPAGGACVQIVEQAAGVN